MTKKRENRIDVFLSYLRVVFFGILGGSFTGILHGVTWAILGGFLVGSISGVLAYLAERWGESKS